MSIQKLGDLLDELNTKGSDAKQLTMIRLDSHDGEASQYIYVGSVSVDSDGDLIIRAKMGYGFG